MIDGHVHIEKDPYSIEYILLYVEKAIERGIDEINLLEHTHRFKEWASLYDPARMTDLKMKKWLDDKKLISINDYHELIKQVRCLELPIKINFGLEVCYFDSKEPFIKEQLSAFDYDFVIGSIHYIYDRAYDLDHISQEILWDKYEINDIYKEYYLQTEKLIQSQLFTQLGHMDTIKKYNIYPTYDLIPTYHHIANLLIQYHMKTECNVGCHYRYGHVDLGLSDVLLNILKEHHVPIITCSDAHQPNDVGILLLDAIKRL